MNSWGAGVGTRTTAGLETGATNAGGEGFEARGTRFVTWVRE